MMNNYQRQFEFTGGLIPDELLFELRVISFKKNLDVIEGYKLQNSAGALMFVGNEHSSDFFITGVVVLDDEIFDEVTSIVRSSTSIYPQCR